MLLIAHQVHFLEGQQRAHWALSTLNIDSDLCLKPEQMRVDHAQAGPAQEKELGQNTDRAEIQEALGLSSP